MEQMKQTLVGHKFKDDRVIVAAMTQWTVTQNTESIDREYKTCSTIFIKPYVEGTLWKSI